MGKYLVSNGYYATERELDAIMRRMDIDQDGKVMYADFSEYIKPRMEWKEMDIEQPGVSPRSPRWNIRES